MRSIFTILVAAGALALAGCNTTPVQDGAVLGGALGAGLGAVIGNQSGHAGEGALIGAGVGALTGALIGDQVAKPAPVQAQLPAPRPAPDIPLAPARRGNTSARIEGHYENRIVHTASGETYEERVWVPY